MKIGPWKLLRSIPRLVILFDGYEDVESELKNIDKARLTELIPRTDTWVADWHRFIDSVKKKEKR